MVTTKIQIDQYLAEYCIGKWGIEFQPPVRFPDWTELYVKIHDLTQKRPVDASVDSGNLEIIIPNRRADTEQPIRKNPDVYNYLSVRSVKNIQKQIRAMMRMEMHEFMIGNKLDNGVDYIDSAHEFKCKYGIVSITDDALIKDYYRWRENIRQRKKRGYTKKN